MNKIWVYSEPPQGTTFKIYFPRADEIPEDIPSTSSRQAPVSGNKAMMLVQDDEAVRKPNPDEPEVNLK